jgi:nucleoid-associated protein YgaU
MGRTRTGIRSYIKDYVETMPTLYEVACKHCGNSVQLSPDASRCPVCGEDLHTLLPPDYSAHYFYQRAAELASRGDVQGALTEAERGLGFVDAPQLRLLAAILSRRLGHMDNVRKHVAAIPVDDRLRPEAEWLLRAQQARKAQAEPKANRAARKAQAAGAALPAQTAPPDRLPTSASQVSVTATRPAPPRAAPVSWTQRFWATMAILLIVVVGALGWVLISRGPEGLVEMLGGPLAGTESGAEAGGGALPLITPAPLPELPPTATPAPATVPGDLVLETGAEPVAVAGSAAAGLAFIGLDLPRVLAEAGRADLAAAPVNAVVTDDRVALSGVISMTQSRSDLVQIVSAVPGVAEVDAVGLLVRLPTTYTVQAGDTLWTIAYKLYGEEPTRVEQLAEANRDTLPAPEALGIGMVLNVPPIEE